MTRTRQPGPPAHPRREELESDTIFDALLTWLSTHKGFVNKLEIKHVSGAGRGLFASRDIKPNEVLLNIPSSALLNPLSLLRSPHNFIPIHLFPFSRSSSSSSTPSSRPSKRLRSSTKPTSTLCKPVGPPLAPPFPTPSPCLPINRLNTTQLLTLHVALSKDSRFPSDWAPFLSTLPQEFRPWHPLTWLISPTPHSNNQLSSSEEEWKWWNRLSECLTVDAKSKMKQVYEKWDGDQSVLRDILVKEESFASVDASSAISDETLLWAWLTVNTRTVSLPLGLPEPTILYNHTFVPLLDMINHSSLPTLTVSQPTHTPSSSSSSTTGSRPRFSTQGGRNNNPFLVPGRIDFQILSSERGMAKGDQVFFSYGGHSNSSLFTDYGFHEVEAKGPWSEVDVGKMVDEVWETEKSCWEKGIEEEKRKVLEAIGCWGHNKLLRSPSPHASHGLLMTLRILYSTSTSKLDSIRSGLITFISPENESQVLDALSRICKQVVTAAKAGLETLRAVAQSGAEIGKDKAEKEEAARWVRLLWEEELDIAGLLLSKLEAGKSVE